MKTQAALVGSATQSEGIFKYTNEEYHAGPGISSTHLKELLVSPLHYKLWLSERRAQTKEQLLGSALHAAVLEPDVYESLYVTQPECGRCVGMGKPRCDYRANECKANKELFEKANAGKLCLTEDQRKTVSRMMDSFKTKIMEHSQLQNLFMGLPEHCFYWTDPDTGVLCKVKPDLLTNIGFCTDLKTTKDARANSFSRDIATYHYHLSAAFYLDGVKACIEKYGKEYGLETAPDTFSIVAIETEAPFDIQCHALGEEWITQGRKLYKKALMRYAKCIQTGVWEGYPQELNVLQMPNYLLYKEGAE